jgi:hypothetical protein
MTIGERRGGLIMQMRIVEILADGETINRQWTGNDDNGFHCHGVVSIDESPLSIRLYWKRATQAPKHLVGTYLLDLYALCERGFVRWEKEYERTLRLRFEHSDDNSIRISKRRRDNGLQIGTFLK